MIQRFKECWDNFIKQQYTGDHKLHILNNYWLRGKSSIWYWGEDDIKLHLSINCLGEFGNQMVHTELYMGKIINGDITIRSRIDLAILNNDPRNYINHDLFQGQNQHGHFYEILNTIDLGVEIALIANERYKDEGYGTKKIYKNILTLNTLIQADPQRITKGVVCFIDNVHENTKCKDYNSLINELNGKFGFISNGVNFDNHCLKWYNKDETLAIFGFFDKHLQPQFEDRKIFLNPNN